MGKKEGCPECGCKKTTQIKKNWLIDQVKCFDCKAIYIEGADASFYEVDE